MNNKLMNIIELIRKDTGINNAIDAVEQLALLLLVRYTHEVASNEISKENLSMPCLSIKGALRCSSQSS